MKKIRKQAINIIVALAGLFLFASAASAIPLEEFFELDLDNWTRLHNAQGDLVPIGDAPTLGDVSRAFITFNDVSETIGPGGADLPAYWTGGDNGTYLHGWEDSVEISQIVIQADLSVNIYFDHVDDTSWEFVVYETGITTLDLITNPALLAGGPSNFNAIQTAIETDVSSVPFMRGRFSDSDYIDPIAGIVTAVAGINLPFISGQYLGGTWLNQSTTPFGMGVNAFVDVDPTWGQGFLLKEGFYGSHPVSGDPYDLAIQNVRLFSESFVGLDGEEWIISDDGVRGSAIPEPATMFLLGTGLVGVAGAARRKKKIQA